MEKSEEKPKVFNLNGVNIILQCGEDCIRIKPQIPNTGAYELQTLREVLPEELAANKWQQRILSDASLLGGLKYEIVPADPNDGHDIYIRFRVPEAAEIKARVEDALQRIEANPKLLLPLKTNADYGCKVNLPIVAGPKNAREVIADRFMHMVREYFPSAQDTTQEKALAKAITATVLTPEFEALLLKAYQQENQKSAGGLDI